MNRGRITTTGVNRPPEKLVQQNNHTFGIERQGNRK